MMSFDVFKEMIDRVERVVPNPWTAQRMARRRYEYYRDIIADSNLDEKTRKNRIIEALAYYGALENRLVDRMCRLGNQF